MKVGDIVSCNYRILGQIIDILSNGQAIVERGSDINIRPVKGLQVAFSIGDRVWIKDTNKSFDIEDFSFNEEANCWKACMNEKTAHGFHGNNRQTWFNINNLELSAMTESVV